MKVVKDTFHDLMILTMLLAINVALWYNPAMDSLFTEPTLSLEFEPYTNRLDKSSNPDDIYWLAKNIYFEARSETIESQTGVACVTINRILDSRFPNTFKEVIIQRHQFSWYWDGESDIPKDTKSWEQATKLATSIVYKYDNGLHEDITNGSTFYHADWMKIKPIFAKSNRYAYEMQIGTHEYYSIVGISL